MGLYKIAILDTLLALEWTRKSRKKCSAEMWNATFRLLCVPTRPGRRMNKFFTRIRIFFRTTYSSEVNFIRITTPKWSLGVLLVPLLYLCTRICIVASGTVVVTRWRTRCGLISGGDLRRFHCSATQSRRQQDKLTQTRPHRSNSRLWIWILLCPSWLI